MEQIQLEQFKRTMERLVEELRQRYGRREELAVEDAADALDQVGNAAGRDLAARQLELSSTRFREVSGALSRMEEGTYGICLECEAEISIKRLKAVPWTPYCISCQESADRKGGHAWPPGNEALSALRG